MKTYEQLMKHYWGVIVPMAEAAGINPWECVRVLSSSGNWVTPTEDHMKRGFFVDTWEYTFALTVLEGKPVFVGDQLYANNCTEPLTIKGLSTIRGNLFVGECMNYDIRLLSWTPPTKNRTFMLGDKELPCPDSVMSDKDGYALNINRYEFWFKNERDCKLVVDSFVDILCLALRNKE